MRMIGGLHDSVKYANITHTVKDALLMDMCRYTETQIHTKTGVSPSMSQLLLALWSSCTTAETEFQSIGFLLSVGRKAVLLLWVTKELSSSPSIFSAFHPSFRNAILFRWGSFECPTNNISGTIWGLRKILHWNYRQLFSKNEGDFGQNNSAII